MADRIIKSNSEYNSGFDLPPGFSNTHSKPSNVSATAYSSTMSPTEKQELADRIKALSREELHIVVDNIPVELCFLRIQNELNRAKEFEKIISEATRNLHTPL